MENNQPYVRVVGNAPEEQKEQARERVRKALSDSKSVFPEKIKKQLAELEYPKSEEELQVIDFVNNTIKSELEDCGVKKQDIPDIPAENYHIIPPELYVKLNDQGSNAAAFIDKQMMIFRADVVRANPFFFGSLAFHERGHIASSLKFEVNRSSMPDEFYASRYREGWSMRASQKSKKEGNSHSHFDGVHEALMTMLQKKMTPRLFELPMFSREKKFRESDEGKRAMKEISERYKVPEDEIIWFNPENTREGDFYSFQKQRQTLGYVFSEIHEQFPGKSVEEIYKDFLNAHSTGRFMSIAHLVEDTFGKRSFRLLGSMGTDPNSAVMTLEILKIARLDFLKEQDSGTETDLTK